MYRYLTGNTENNKMVQREYGNNRSGCPFVRLFEGKDTSEPLVFNIMEALSQYEVITDLFR